jgi:hypothetical protein
MRHFRLLRPMAAGFAQRRQGTAWRGGEACGLRLPSVLGFPAERPYRLHRKPVDQHLAAKPYRLLRGCRSLPLQQTGERDETTIMPIFCGEGAFAGGAANRENRRFNTLFPMLELKNTVAFPPPVADLKRYIFAFSGGCPNPHTGMGDGAAVWAHGASRPAALSYAAARATTRSRSFSISRRIRWRGYLKSAMRKLESVRCRQAVATAFQYWVLIKRVAPRFGSLSYADRPKPLRSFGRSV